MWEELILSSDISKKTGAISVRELVDLGCSICRKTLYMESSPGGFGSLFCVEHGIVWMFGLLSQDRLIPYRKGKASKYWKNFITGEMSKFWLRKYGDKK